MQEAFLAFFLFFIAVPSLVTEGAPSIFQVADFGAKGDGQTDDSKAFLQAWNATCGAKDVDPILNIPSGKTFLLQPLKFSGPCASGSVLVKVGGNIVAPKTVSAWEKTASNSWLFFSGVRNLSIVGSGQIDGQGSAWWTKTRNFYLQALLLGGCENLRVTGLTHMNSPRNHISIDSCTGVIISNLTIIAPEDSPNTDGIDIIRSTYVQIQDSNISTGDDCVAINGNNSHIRILNVFCGPGHGISVGSLGGKGRIDNVEDVYVHNCTFNGTQNGARIKTWEGGQGFARNISFSQITLIATQNPIIIDQHYCNGEHNCVNGTTAIAVSDVTYSDFRGTSSKEEAIRLDCSDINGCTNVVMNTVQITPSDPSINKTTAYCNHAKGIYNNVTPSVGCLTRS
ncbi:probable polygalacturonase At3g15720 [Mercurialis annua]|uniref:probable polygalacturonase At3g15720 n=1 Tax=Mercurialis annua TaxID=3986 RepID=UPI002160E6C4|nr:probable polygalacturonase At3g15720 [Mercurialis annua]